MIPRVRSPTGRSISQHHQERIPIQVSFSCLVIRKPSGACDLPILQPEIARPTNSRRVVDESRAERLADVFHPYVEAEYVADINGWVVAPVEGGGAGEA